MEKPRIEAHGNSEAKDEKPISFAWRDHVTKSTEAIDLARKVDRGLDGLYKWSEDQLDLIQELALAENINFEQLVEEKKNGASLLLEEGMISQNEAEFRKRKITPILEMIGWGERNGIIKSKEAESLRDLYK